MQSGYFYPLLPKWDCAKQSKSKSSTMKVYVDPACDILYTSLYIEGLRRLYGKNAVKFTSEYFRGFRHNNDYVCMIFEGEDGSRCKVAIDFGDSKSFRMGAYEWSDVYAKVNLTQEDHQAYPKSFPIGPVGPGVRIFSLPGTLIRGSLNFLAAFGRIPDKKRFISDYKAQLRRLPYERYLSTGVANTDYVHFVTSIWKNDPETNAYRADFMRAVKGMPGLHFEGGFAPRPDKVYLGYDDLIGESFEPLEVYMGKIMRSLVVFNTPAVKKCHGWKLPEFLAWGKAIISTPLMRMLPAPLVDGEHLLITDGSREDMERKIRLLMNEPELRHKLEQNAHRYYMEYLAADRVIVRILERAGFVSR